MSASTEKKPLIKRCPRKPVSFNFGIDANISYGNEAFKTTEAA